MSKKTQIKTKTQALRFSDFAPVPRAKTRSVMAGESVASLRQTATFELQIAQGDLSKWQAKFESDPAYAFSWSSDAFVSAAKAAVAKYVIEVIDAQREPVDEYTVKTDEQVLKVLREGFYAAVLRGAKWPERSTSMPSNEMASQLVAQKAEWLEKFDNHLARLNRAV